MSRHVVFLASPLDASNPAPANDNYRRLPEAFRSAQWQVTEAAFDELHLKDSEIYCDTVRLSDADLIWPIGFGRREGFFDRLQLLAQLPQHLMLTPAERYLTHHGKAVWLHHSVATRASNNAAQLLQWIAAEQQDWIVKPLAGSLGRSVVHLQASESAVQLSTKVHAVMAQAPGEYFVLQPFLATVSAGETRTLVADGNIIGSYLRVPDDGVRANLAQRSSAKRTDLSPSAQALVKSISHDLIELGIGFAAIDTVAGHLMEVNIATPGGLATLAELYQADFAARVVAAIEHRRYTTENTQ